jgi:tetratricopeptide (TPR) repeat protein
MAYASEVERLEQLFKDKPEQYFAPLAEAYRKAGNIDFALEVLRVNLEKRPAYVSAHIVLGRCYLDQKNDAEAARVFEHVLTLDGENIIALRILGEVEERRGNLEEAYRWVKRLLEVDPMNEDAQDAIKRLEPAAKPLAPARAVAEPPPAVVHEDPPAAVPEPGVVSGFEPTASSDGSLTVESEEGPDLVAARTPSADLGIERSESALESSEVTQETPARSPRITTGLELSRELVEPDSGEADAPVPEAASRRSGGRRMDAEEPRPPVDLPFILPEETPEPVAEVPNDQAEPEPVITETMAEVYLKQGLVAEARDVYRRLLERRPNDSALRARMEELTRRASSPKVARFGPAAPGGVSARSLLTEVLASRPGPASSAIAAPSPAQPSGKTALDHAFADESSQSQGAPTRPTTDELSLSAVFGEETAAPARASGSPSVGAPAAPSAPAMPPSGFSFDEFFGGKKDDDAPPPAAEVAPASSPDASEGDATPPDDFLAWLKGLKS